MIRLSSRLFGFTATTRSQRRSRCAPRLEVLEDRTVPSTLTVTNNLDTGVPKDGSLRGEIAAAAQSGDKIVFAPSLAGKTITLTQGELAVNKSLDIEGLGALRLIISGNDTTRVFDIGSGATVTIAGLTITHGQTDGHDLSIPLATFGGGILNQGNLTLTNDIVSHNLAAGSTNVLVGDHLAGGAGGGIANAGKLTVTGSTFFDNEAQGANDSKGQFFTKGGNITFPGLGIGGDLLNLITGTANVSDSRFIDNVAQGGSNDTGTFAGVGQGGAIYNDATLTVARTSFLDNQALGGSNNVSDLYSGLAVGGGISSGTHEVLGGSTTSAVLTVSQSVFSLNRAVAGDNNSVGPPIEAAGLSDGFGGGIFVFQGSATITQSVLDFNQAIGGEGGGGKNGSLGVGGGIFFFDFLGGVTATVQGCAIVGNAAIGGAATSGRGGDALGGGLAAGLVVTPFSKPGTVTVSNTLLAGNLAQGGRGGSGANGGNGLGGGVFNDAKSTLTVSDSLLALNQAVGGTGGAAGNGGNGLGGGLYNAGTASFTTTIIAFNRAKGGAAGSGGSAGTGDGGGVYNTGTFSIDDTKFIFGNQPDNGVGF